MAMRIMAAYFKVGRTVDEPYPNFSSWSRDTFGYVHAGAEEGYQQINFHVDVRGEHAALIREVAAKGTVLLKNTGALPLDKPKFLAVIGEDAGPNINGPNGCADRGCDKSVPPFSCYNSTVFVLRNAPKCITLAYIAGD